MEILAAILALVLGALVGYLYGRRFGTAPADQQAREAEQRALTDARQDAATARSEASRAREESATIKAEIAHHLAEKSELKALAAEAQRLVAEARSETAQVQAVVAATTAERDAALQKAAEQAADREVLLNQFKVLSAETLERQGQQADAAAELRLKATEQLVAPLAEGLRQMDAKLQQVEKDRVRMSAELGEQVKSVRLSGEAIRRETLSLSTALRTPQVRGAWGETGLKRIVELAGLTDRVDFHTQATHESDDGRFRPDLRVNLPGGKVIFVDSKVPLVAALDAYNTEDVEQQKAHFQQFAKSVRTHVDQLSGKHYWQLDVGSPEFVVLYLPSDEVYRLALEHLPDLHDYASRRRVVLACPGLLIPQLQIVANGWKQVALAERAGEVTQLGRQLYERLATLGTHFDKLGRSLRTSVDSYNRAVGAMESRVMVTARKFRDLEVTDDELIELNPVTEATRELAVREMIDHAETRKAEQEALTESTLTADVPLRQLPRQRSQGA